MLMILLDNFMIYAMRRPVRKLLNNAELTLRDHFKDLLQISSVLQDLETNYKMSGVLEI